MKHVKHGVHKYVHIFLFPLLCYNQIQEVTIMFKEKTTMYVWGTPVTISFDVYLWIMKGETRDIRLKRAMKVLCLHRRKGLYF